MKKPLRNYAFIDGTNLHRSTIGMGWKIDWKKLKRYLEEVYGVAKAFYFIGYVASNQRLYSALESYGYELVYKPTFSPKAGRTKGNVDAELVLKSMTHYRVYEKAIIITSDGDFACLVEYLRKKNKLRSVIASSRKGCSHLLKKAGGTCMCYMDDLRSKLQY